MPSSVGVLEAKLSIRSPKKLVPATGTGWTCDHYMTTSGACIEVLLDLGHACAFPKASAWGLEVSCDYR